MVKKRVRPKPSKPAAPTKPVEPSNPQDPVTPVEPIKPPRKRRRRVPKTQVAGYSIDWYAVGLAVLAAITLAPYVLPFLKDNLKPKPAVIEFDTGNVSSWFSNVASDDPRADLPKYVEALRAVAGSEIDDIAKIPDKLKEEVESRLERSGWLNWGLFNIELLKEMRRLRESKKLDSVDSHKQFLIAVADTLERV